MRHNDMSYWHDKVAIVTGGSAGLGLAIAQSLGQQRAKVVIAARREEGLERARMHLKALGYPVVTEIADVTQDDDVQRLVQNTLERYKRLDLMVNNAGRSMRSEVIGTTPDQFRELMELNLLGVVRCSQAAVPHLLSTGGHLVNIGSLASKSVAPYLGAYPATKFAVAAYTHQLRLELAPQGVHVLLVCPGPIHREDSETRYSIETSGLPEQAKKPGAGVRVRRIKAHDLSEKILQACRHRQPEVVVPGKARWLFAISQLAPRCGDWLLRRFTR